MSRNEETLAIIEKVFQTLSVIIVIFTFSEVLFTQVKFNVLLRNRKLSLTSELRLWPQFPQCSPTPLPKLTVGPLHNQSTDPLGTESGNANI